MLTTRAWVLPVLLGLYATSLNALPLSSGDEKLDPSLENANNSTSEVCLYEGVVYAKGEKTAKPGPCEECVCQPPSVVCSMIKCPVQSGCRIIQRVNQCCPDYKCECEYNGQMYNNGERMDTRDEPCKVCYCKGGEVMCTSISCYHRDDCEPHFVAGQCCPKYDHCPLKDINPLDEKDDTSANNRSYVYSPKREMQPWLLTKSVEVKVAPTVLTQVLPKSTENIPVTSSEMTTRSNDEQQQTWNNIIISDWLTERRTTTEEDGSSTRITVYGNTENDLNFKYSPTTETIVSTDLNTNPFVIVQENRSKTEHITSGPTTSTEIVTEIINEDQVVTETGTELNTVITETPYTDKLATIVLKETSANQFTTITSDIAYNDERNTEIPLHFVKENTTNKTLLLQESEDSRNSEATKDINKKVQSINKVSKNYASTSPPYVETSSTFPHETHTVLFTENNKGITKTDYEPITDIYVSLTEGTEIKMVDPEDKSADRRTDINTSTEETIITTVDTSDQTDLVTQSTSNNENENENKENLENLMLKDTILLNIGSKRETYSNNERNTTTDDNDHKESLQETETTPIETTTVRFDDEQTLNAQKLQTEKENEEAITGTVYNESGTEAADNSDKVNQSKIVESVINTDIPQLGSTNIPDNEQVVIRFTEETTKHSDRQEINQKSNDNSMTNENTELDSANAEEVGTEVNNFNSDDGNKNIDDYSYEPPVLELNSQLPFLQIGGHGSMEILSTDSSEEDSIPESENIQPFIDENVNNMTVNNYEEPSISSSTHIPLTPGDLKILAEYLIKEKIKPTINESSTYMPTEWLKGNLTSNTTKIATILSAANISIGIINRNNSESRVKLTDVNLENKTLLQESVTTQTLESLLNNKGPVTDTVDRIKIKQNTGQESDDTAVTLPSSLEVTYTDANETVITERIALTELLSTTSDYSSNKDNLFVENLNESNQLQGNKNSENGELKEMVKMDRITGNNAENITENNNENFNSINVDGSKKNLSLSIHRNTAIDKVLPTSENSSTKSNEVDGSSGNLKQENKEIYENVFYPEDNSDNTNNLKNLNNHKKRINPGESDEYTSRKVRIPEMESIVKEPFSASLDDNDLTILKEFIKKHMVMP